MARTMEKEPAAPPAEEEVSQEVRDLMERLPDPPEPGMTKLEFAKDVATIIRRKHAENEWWSRQADLHR
jgi:hypothetical protein